MNALTFKYKSLSHYISLNVVDREDQYIPRGGKIALYKYSDVSYNYNKSIIDTDSFALEFLGEEQMYQANNRIVTGGDVDVILTLDNDASIVYLYPSRIIDTKSFKVNINFLFKDITIDEIVNIVRCHLNGIHIFGKPRDAERIEKAKRVLVRSMIESVIETFKYNETEHVVELNKLASLYTYR